MGSEAFVKHPSRGAGVLVSALGAAQRKLKRRGACPGRTPSVRFGKAGAEGPAGLLGPAECCASR